MYNFKYISIHLKFWLCFFLLFRGWWHLWCGKQHCWIISNYQSAASAEIVTVLGESSSTILGHMAQEKPEY